MKTNWVLLTAYFLTATVSFLQAQSPSAVNNFPPPKLPLVAPVPDSAQWTITLAYDGDGQDQLTKNPADKHKHRLHQIVSTKTQNLKRDVDLFDDGISETYWFTGNLILVPESNGKDVAIIDFEKANSPVYGEAGNPVSSPGFAGVGWVKLSYYDKVASMQNVPCYHYALRSGDTTEIEAWINAKTGFPVAYRTGGITYAYAFGSTPESDLVLPPNYAQALKGHQQIEDRRKQLEKDLGG